MITSPEDPAVVVGPCVVDVVDDGVIDGVDDGLGSFSHHVVRIV